MTKEKVKIEIKLTASGVCESGDGTLLVLDGDVLGFEDAGLGRDCEEGATLKIICHAVVNFIDAKPDPDTETINYMRVMKKKV